MRLLLLSNSKVPGLGYLEYGLPHIKDFLGKEGLTGVFIPFANCKSYDAYEEKVINALAPINITVKSVHKFEDPHAAVMNADFILVGGGNTWRLTREIHSQKLDESIRKAVIEKGVPYIGWSAGSNLACPTIKTTNDMPITDPLGLEALNFVPFQINPHYLHGNPDGHMGETREERILEFLEENKTTTVVGLREGAMFRVEGDKIQHLGDRDCRIFVYGKEPYELKSSDDFQFLM